MRRGNYGARQLMGLLGAIGKSGAIGGSGADGEEEWGTMENVGLQARRSHGPGSVSGAGRSHTFPDPSGGLLVGPGPVGTAPSPTPAPQSPGCSWGPPKSTHGRAGVPRAPPAQSPWIPHPCPAQGSHTPVQLRGARGCAPLRALDHHRQQEGHCPLKEALALAAISHCVPPRHQDRQAPQGGGAEPPQPPGPDSSYMLRKAKADGCGVPSVPVPPSWGWDSVCGSTGGD